MENYLFAVVAALIVVVRRRSMLHRGTGVTEVLMRGDERHTVSVPAG